MKLCADLGNDRTLKTGELFSFVRLHLDVILVSLGFILFVVGFFNMVPFPEYSEYGSYSHIVFYQTIYSLCFTFSVIFIVVGFAVRSELFVETTFEGKWGSTMLCSSLPLLIIAVLLHFYREVIDEIGELIVIQRGHEFETILLHRLVYNYPYMWLSSVLGSIGFCCLIFGLFLKLRQGI